MHVLRIIYLSLLTWFCLCPSQWQWILSPFVFKVDSTLCALESISLRTWILQIAFFSASLCIFKFSSTGSLPWSYRHFLISSNSKQNKTKQNETFLGLFILLQLSSSWFPFGAKISESFMCTHCLYFPIWLSMIPIWLVSITLETILARVTRGWRLQSWTSI